MGLLTNPWVVGIGVTLIGGVVAGLILYFGFGIGRTKSAQQIADIEQSGSPTLEETAKSNITPKEIHAYLDSLPPLQREAVAKNYEGIGVSWKVTLSDASNDPIYGGKTYLIMRHEAGNEQVCCKTDLNEYPQLKVMKHDQLFTVQGEIEAVDRLTIRLKNCRLLF